MVEPLENKFLVFDNLDAVQGYLNDLRNNPPIRVELNVIYSINEKPIKPIEKEPLLKLDPSFIENYKKFKFLGKFLNTNQIELQIYPTKSFNIIGENPKKVEDAKIFLGSLTCSKYLFDDKIMKRKESIGVGLRRVYYEKVLGKEIETYLGDKNEALFDIKLDNHQGASCLLVLHKRNFNMEAFSKKMKKFFSSCLSISLNFSQELNIDFLNQIELIAGNKIVAAVHFKDKKAYVNFYGKLSDLESLLNNPRLDNLKGKVNVLFYKLLPKDMNPIQNIKYQEMIHMKLSEKSIIKLNEPHQKDRTSISFEVQNFCLRNLIRSLLTFCNERYINEDKMFIQNLFGK